MQIFQRKRERKNCPPAHAIGISTFHPPLPKTSGKWDSRQRRPVWTGVLPDVILKSYTTICIQCIMHCDLRNNSFMSSVGSRDDSWRISATFCLALNRIHQRGGGAGREDAQETALSRHVLTQSQVTEKTVLSQYMINMNVSQISSWETNHRRFLEIFWTSTFKRVCV